jgi:hypothetical protein
MAPWSHVDKYWCFKGTYSLCLKGRSICHIEMEEWKWKCWRAKGKRGLPERQGKIWQQEMFRGGFAVPLSRLFSPQMFGPILLGATVSNWFSHGLLSFLPFLISLYFVILVAYSTALREGSRNIGISLPNYMVSVEDSNLHVLCHEDLTSCSCCVI